MFGDLNDFYNFYLNLQAIVMCYQICIFLLNPFFLQSAGGSAGRDHHGSPGPPEPAGPGLGPGLRCTGGGGEATASADWCPGTS